MDSEAESIVEQMLFARQDTGYRSFSLKLVPNCGAAAMIGVRSPAVREIAKELKGSDTAVQFLSQLPHRYHEENAVHARLIEFCRDFDECVALISSFLPYVSNWAISDGFDPPVFRKNTERLLPYIRGWAASGETYTVRFGLRMLMSHYLGGNFDTKYLDLAASVHSDEYYVNMMLAWYFATALAKQYDKALKVLTDNRLDVWVHNKTIQKAVESYRITPQQKEYLKTLRR